MSSADDFLGDCSAAKEAKLAERLAVGNKIVQLVALCKKYETQERNSSVVSMLENPQMQGLRHYRPMLLAPQGAGNLTYGRLDLPSKKHSSADSAAAVKEAPNKTDMQDDSAEESWRIGAGRAADASREILTEVPGDVREPKNIPSTDMATTIQALYLTA